MADPSIHKPQVADPSSIHPALNDEDVDTLGDSDVTYVTDETNAVDETAAAGETPDPVHGFLDFREYRANDTIVHRVSKEIYNNNSGIRLHENLVERQDIKYQGFDWYERFAWHNETNSPNTYTRTVTEGLTIREGEETERNFSVGAEFRGLSVSAGGSRKTFSERETSRLESVEKEIVVEPQASTYFYQKRYNFLTEVWFWQRVPGWTEHNFFRIGANRTFAIVKRTAVTSIFSQEFATLLRRLDGTTTITAQAGPPLAGDPTTIRQFDNITQRAKNTLAGWGITG